jgi:hypothetical protein
MRGKGREDSRGCSSNDHFCFVWRGCTLHPHIRLKSANKNQEEPKQSLRPPKAKEGSQRRSDLEGRSKPLPHVVGP